VSDTGNEQITKEQVPTELARAGRTKEQRKKRELYLALLIAHCYLIF
jgi:hypothetical protein